MPCNRGSASAQIKRLSGIPFFSKLSSAAVDELILALTQYATDSTHATNAITALLHDPERNKEVPTPAVLIQYLAATRKAPPAKFEGCADCGGTGFIAGPTIWRNFHGVRQPYSGVKKCHCHPANSPQNCESR